MRNMYWYDDTTNRIKIATHFRFDEDMSDLPNLTPKIQILQRYENEFPVNLETIVPPDYNLTVEPTPFHHLDTVPITITCEFPTFGIELGECHIRHHVYIISITPNSSVSDIRKFKRKFVDAFIVEINHQPVFDVNDATTLFEQIFQDDTIERFYIVLAPERYVPRTAVNFGIRCQSNPQHYIHVLSQY